MLLPDCTDDGQAYMVVNRRAVTMQVDPFAPSLNSMRESAGEIICRGRRDCCAFAELRELFLSRVVDGRGAPHPRWRAPLSFAHFNHAGRLHCTPPVLARVVTMPRSARA